MHTARPLPDDGGGMGGVSLHHDPLVQPALDSEKDTTRKQ